MPRVKRGTTHVKRRRKLLKQAKGFKWGRKNLIKQASTAVTKKGVNAYRGRKQRKRDIRGLWNIKINAAARMNGVTYSKLMDGLKKKDIGLNRKVLAELAEHNPEVFAAIVKSI